MDIIQSVGAVSTCVTSEEATEPMKASGLRAFGLTHAYPALISSTL
jgi:hypothetical protein